ncbi:MAG TPA: DNA mismatch repair protein MutT [Elusimicrobia bacterium]|nr:MAG: DNA mismatch repair protein MutT [Elusimicrobia bacterium GWD2_63_28]HCC48737.1 DNA mismatch repair protein MutT [Elusimicrobiota bacterium]
MKLATLCYVQKNGKTLMLHRVKKADDVHEGKWNGLGGKLETGESPEDCVIREIREEAGLKIRAPKLKGVLTFPDFAKSEDWYVFVFTASNFTGRLIDSPEGNLAWIPNRDLLKLNLWEGDKVFLPLLRRKGHFSGKFQYRGGRLLKYSVEKY